MFALGEDEPFAHGCAWLAGLVACWSSAKPTNESSGRSRVSLRRQADAAVIRGTGARAGVAGVQDDHDVGLLLRHLGNQQGQFLVGQIPTAVRAAVVADDGLVQVVRLQVPELGRRLLLRAVAAVVEQGDVVRASLAEVVAEAVDHRLAGRLDLVGFW